MTFQEIYIKVLDRMRMESTDIEPNIEAQIKHSINRAYVIVAGKNKQLLTDYLPVIQGVVELPKNIVGSVEYDPALSPTLDRIVGDSLLTKREDGEIFTIRYYATPEPLVAETDAPNIPTRLEECLILYPCFVYFLSKKRLDLASTYKMEFTEILDGSEIRHDAQSAIENVYGSIF